MGRTYRARRGRARVARHRGAASGEAPPGLVALGAAVRGRVQEHERILPELLGRHAHDAPRADEPRDGAPHGPLALEPARAEPAVGEGEPRAAVVVLAVGEDLPPAVAEDRARARDAVRDAGERL